MHELIYAAHKIHNLKLTVDFLSFDKSSDDDAVISRHISYGKIMWL